MRKHIISSLIILTGCMPASIMAQDLNNSSDSNNAENTQYLLNKQSMNTSADQQQAIDANDSLSFDYANYEKKVLDYSKTLKQSIEKQIAVKKAMQVAKTAFLPAVDATGTYQYRINDYDMPFGDVAIPMKHDSYSAGISVMQPIYQGGSIVNTYQSQKIQSSIAEQSVNLTTDNIIHAAENSYWGASAQKEMYEVMCHYTEIVGQLLEVLEDRYNDGMISKTDLIQMQVRKKDAEMQRLNSLEQYKLAMQAMNVLMGRMPSEKINILEKISAERETPTLTSVESIMNIRPDFAISKLSVDYQKKQLRVANSKYNPTLAVGFQGIWGTQMLNINGDTKFNSTLMVSLKVPIFRWGARFKTNSAQRALVRQKEYELQDKQDNIAKELAAAWTNVIESEKRIDIAKENCVLADENLDLNTFSYKEGKLSILDVLSAQLTWIQAYTNLVQSHYQQKIALASYNKVSGSRYMK